MNTTQKADAMRNALHDFLAEASNDLTRRQEISQALLKPFDSSQPGSRLAWAIDNWETVSIDQERKRVWLPDGTFYRFHSIGGQTVQFLQWLGERAK